jgi:L-ascorbate metabolism protein UlaG (beta-lactamase superfamily)
LKKKAGLKRECKIKMKIIYAHHSGFIIENGANVIFIDCCGFHPSDKYADKRLYMLASHSHGDHFDKNIFTYRGAEEKWILSSDIWRKPPPHVTAHYLSKGDVYSDSDVKIKAYGSTDKGISFYIETGGFKVFHAGDLNNWHWNEEETPKDAKKNEQWYLDELDIIARDIDCLDAVMFPVDPRLGKDYMKGAEQFIERIKVGLFVPMHFWDNYKAAAAFKPIAESKGCHFAAINKAGDEFEVV